MSTFYPNAIGTMRALLAQNDGAFIGHDSGLLYHFPGCTMSDVRAICERGIADGVVAGYGHRPNGPRSHRLVAVAAANGPGLSGFRPGFNTLADNATCYVALHPDHEGRAVVAKFGRSNDIDNRRHALFPHSQRLLPSEEVFTLDSPNASQAEQILRLAFSALTVGGENRQIREYVRAPRFRGAIGRNLGQSARDLTFALLVEATKSAVAQLADLDTIDRHDPAQRAIIANRIVANLRLRFNVKTVRMDNGQLSFAR